MRSLEKYTVFSLYFRHIRDDYFASSHCNIDMKMLKGSV